jgi:hypothetical protein
LRLYFRHDCCPPCFHFFVVQVGQLLLAPEQLLGVLLLNFLGPVLPGLAFPTGSAGIFRSMHYNRAYIAALLAVAASLLAAYVWLGRSPKQASLMH